MQLVERYSTGLLLDAVPGAGLCTTQTSSITRSWTMPRQMCWGSASICRSRTIRSRRAVHRRVGACARPVPTCRRDNARPKARAVSCFARCRSCSRCTATRTTTSTPPRKGSGDCSRTSWRTSPCRCLHPRIPCSRSIGCSRVGRTDWLDRRGRTSSTCGSLIWSGRRMHCWDAHSLPNCR